MTPRTDFDKNLTHLQDELLLLGGMVEKAVARSMDALRRRDLEASRQVVKEDDIIDQKRFDLEERCIELIATQQPLAGDLRILVTVLHVAVELERMGDYAEGIAKISLMMGDEPPLKPLIDIPRMADLSAGMLRRSLDAFVNRDVVSAMAVCDDDDKVDDLYDQVYRVAHNLERMLARPISLICWRTPGRSEWRSARASLILRSSAETSRFSITSSLIRRHWL